MSLAATPVTCHDGILNICVSLSRQIFYHQKRNWRTNEDTTAYIKHPRKQNSFWNRHIFIDICKNPQYIHTFVSQRRIIRIVYISTTTENPAYPSVDLVAPPGVTNLYAQAEILWFFKVANLSGEITESCPCLSFSMKEIQKAGNFATGGQFDNTTGEITTILDKQFRAQNFSPVYEAGI